MIASKPDSKLKHPYSGVEEQPESFAVRRFQDAKVLVVLCGPNVVLVLCLAIYAYYRWWGG